MYSKIFITISLFAISYFSTAQEINIQGKISNVNQESLSNCTVKVIELQFHTTSNKDGIFKLKLPKGQYHLLITRMGYLPLQKAVKIEGNQPLKWSFELVEQHQALQQVEIIGNKKKSYKSNSTFIGSKSEIALKDLPQSVSYVTKELMLDQGNMRVGEVVKNFSGVNQFTFYDDITIRGFRVNGGSNTQLMNGMRTTTGFWKQPLTNYLERVEVLKGPSSAIYGNAMPGGVINRVTKKPLDETRKSVSVSMGSFNNLRALADFTGPANKDSTLLYRLNIGYEDARSFRDLQFDKNLIIAPSISFRPNEKTQLNFDLVYSDSKGRLDRGQSLYKGERFENSDITRSLSVANDYLNEKTYNASFSLIHKIDSNSSFNASYMRTGYNEDLYEHRGANDYFKDGKGDDISNLVSMQIFKRNRLRYMDNLSTYYNLKTNGAFWKHNFVIGMDYGSQKLLKGSSQLNALSYRNASNTAAIAKFDVKKKGDYLLDALGNPIPNVMPYDLNNPIQSQKMQDDSKYLYIPAVTAPTFYYLLAGYVQDQITIGKLKALIGLRYERYFDFDKYATKDQKLVKSSVLLPRLGLVYTINENINAYGTYVEGYNPQTASNLANPNAGGPFDPLSSNMLEFGIKSDWLQHRLSITSSIYQIQQKNTLYNANDLKNPDLLVPIGKEISRGIEFDVVGNLLPNWNVMASYAFSDGRVKVDAKGNQVNNQMPNAPRNTANLWSRYNFTQSSLLKGFGFGLGVNYVDQRVGSISNNFFIPSYTLINAALYYKLNKMQLQANINNLMNKKHWVGGYDAIRLFPGAPANLLFTVSYEF